MGNEHAPDHVAHTVHEILAHPERYVDNIDEMADVDKNTLLNHMIHGVRDEQGGHSHFTNSHFGASGFSGSGHFWPAWELQRRAERQRREDAGQACGCHDPYVGQPVLAQKDGNPPPQAEHTGSLEDILKAAKKDKSGLIHVCSRCRQPWPKGLFDEKGKPYRLPDDKTPEYPTISQRRAQLSDVLGPARAEVPHDGLDLGPARHRGGRRV